MADASHELRTPLAVIRANAEFLQQEQPESEEAAEILAETDRLGGARRLAARARPRPGRRGTPTARSTWARSCRTRRTSMQPLASDRKVALAVDTAPGPRGARATPTSCAGSW